MKKNNKQIENILNELEEEISNLYIKNPYKLTEYGYNGAITEVKIRIITKKKDLENNRIIKY